jgi:peptide subunit release factor RF-3
MRRLVILTMLTALSGAWPLGSKAQTSGVVEYERASREEYKKQQKASRKAMKRQLKINKKATRNQEKAMKRYEKQQRKQASRQGPVPGPG